MQRKALRSEPESKASRDALARVKKAAKEWVEKNNKEGIAEQTFTKEDRRLFWGAYDQDLVAARKFYYDQEPHKYDELSALKQQLDPNCIFTANKFSIGPHPPRLMQKVSLANVIDYQMLLTIRWSIEVQGQPQLSRERWMEELLKNHSGHESNCLHGTFRYKFSGSTLYLLHTS